MTLHQLRLDRLPDPPLAGHLAMGDASVGVDSRQVTRHGRPWIPVSGEFHYSRVPSERWEEELLKLKAGGITAVASYLIWLHHEQAEGQLSFEGNLDVRRFAELCVRHGLDFVARIGPWVHAETRNGGLPDWVLAKGCPLRTDDPAYLELVRAWYTGVAAQLAGIPLLAVQIENELYDNPDHLLTLKSTAIEAGLTAPLWTATAWAAKLPQDELLPLFGGYPETFWDDYDTPWPQGCRTHFHFTHERDDQGIGADLRPLQATASNVDNTRYPMATCELGGGMAAAYHRRPVVTADDVAALSLTKLGSGSNWQGYYMYRGGTNPGPDLQESHASGYPNDMPQLSYDFQAPIGEYGQLRDSYHLLRLQNLLVADFGEQLAPMVSVLPEQQPYGVTDAETLRWALRTDGEHGFLFVNNHQMYEPLPDHLDVRFRLELPGGTVTLPSTPVTVPSGAYFCWPVNLELAGLRIAWASAQPVCLLGDLLVLAAIHGIPPEIALDPATTAPGAQHLLQDLAPGPDCLLTVATAVGGTVRILVLDQASARRLYKGEVQGQQHLALAAGSVVFDRGTLRTDADEIVLLPVLAGATGFECHHAPTTAPDDVAVPVELLRAAGPPPSVRLNGIREPGVFGSGRASAPTDYTEAAVLRLAVPAAQGPQDRLLRIEWSGDTARAYCAGRLIADQFFTGRPWEIGLGPEAAEIELRLLPAAPDAHVHVADSVRHRLTDAAVLDARLVHNRLWTLPS